MKLSFGNLFFVKKEMFSNEKQEYHEKHHEKYVWVYYVIMVLGLWLLTAPLIFGFTVSEMKWHNFISGILLIVFSAFSLRAYNLWAKWALIFLGLWMFIAPLVFWAKEETAFFSNFFIATLVFTFGIVIPSQPGIKLFSQSGPNVPPKWSYNPSKWTERIPVITLAWFGFFAAQYLGAFQFGFISKVWDPFFGDGTRNVLLSDVSKSFPVSDAALGAFAYLLDILMGIVGGTHRWRTMPWVIIIFGILIIPLGVVSITLVILQPVAVGSWCSLCLFSAFISLLMIPFTLDEVLATIQLIKYERKKGNAFWAVFWFGGTMEEGRIENKEDTSRLLNYTGKSMLGDISTKPWNLFASAVLGIWVMVAPEVLGYSKAIADSNHLSGALIVTFSVITMSEVARPARFINILFGIWLVVAPWVLNSDFKESIWNGIISGFLLILLSFRKGRVIDKRGDFDKYIF